MSVTVAKLDQWSAREARGMSKLEFERLNFVNTTRELLTNSDLKEERIQVLKPVIHSLTSRSPVDKS